ncbi:uncharacterized protein LOC125539209 isoform X1 [Triticum urartu]|nr:uncharacterized protein LOC125539209 isoform X1 [Triticum urartu]
MAQIMIPYDSTSHIEFSGKGKVVAITIGRPALMPGARDSTMHHSVVEEEGKPSKELPVETLNTVKRKRQSTYVQNAESRTTSGKEKVVAITTGEPALKSRVRDSTTHPQKVQKEKNGRKNGSKKMKLVEEEGKPSKELPVETLNIVKRKRKSSNVQNAESRTASELHGVVWPTHIMERPDSEFKEKLMRLLRKPFSQGECDTLLDKATTRPPATMKRQTRGGVKYYNSEHERQPSYFDGHPDLAKQVRVESTSKPNQLALLRGFFFWMENIAHHDQFRPWRDDFKQYKVTMVEIE